MSKVFNSDIFDWARDLAIIQRIFGTAHPAAVEAELIDINAMRPATPADLDDVPLHKLANAAKATQR